MKIVNLKDNLEYLNEVVLLEHNEWAREPEKNKQKKNKRKRREDKK